MPAVGLNTALLHQLVGGSIKDVLDRWGNRYSEVPDRTTIHRWIKEGTIPRGEEYLRLCSVLDVDPVSLLVASDGDTPKAMEHLLVSQQLDQWKQPGLAFLREFFGRQHNWPPPAVALNYFGRAWHVGEIVHEPKRDHVAHYGVITIDGSPDVYPSRPQIVHVAFQQPGLFRERWLEFGIITRLGNVVQLLHINGHHDSYTTGSPVEPAHFETMLGLGRAVFRLASLHSFTARISQRPQGAQRMIRFV